MGGRPVLWGAAGRRGTRWGARRGTWAQLWEMRLRREQGLRARARVMKGRQGGGGPASSGCKVPGLLGGDWPYRSSREGPVPRGWRGGPLGTVRAGSWAGGRCDSGIRRGGRDLPSSSTHVSFLHHRPTPSTQHGPSRPPTPLPLPPLIPEPLLPPGAYAWCGEEIAGETVPKDRTGLDGRGRQGAGPEQAPPRKGAEPEPEPRPTSTSWLHLGPQDLLLPQARLPRPHPPHKAVMKSR